MFITKKSHGKEDFADAKAIRTEVFVTEQGFQMEFDDIDNTACHLVIYDDGIPAAVGRVYPVSESTWAIGRVAVRKPWRGTGLGAYLMRELEAAARTLGAEGFTLSAQVRASGFYQKQRYTPIGEVYTEEGVAHIRMQKQA